MKNATDITARLLYHTGTMRAAGNYGMVRVLTDAAEEIDMLRKTVEQVGCPRPMNGRPDDLTVKGCCDLHECGCMFGIALGRSEYENQKVKK